MNREKPFFSKEAEMAVLGGIILDASNQLNSILPKIKEDYFYFTEHRKIFSVIIKMYNSNEKIDIVTLKNRLKRENLLSEIGGDDYLQMLTDKIDMIPNLDEYVNIVEENFILRHMIGTAKVIVDDCNTEKTVDEIIENAESSIFKVRESRYKADIISVSDSIPQIHKMIDTYMTRKQLVTGVPTGFKDLDEMTTGFQKGELIVLAARPGVGKTSFALNMLSNQCVKTQDDAPKYKGLIFSLEMTSEQLIQRMLCSYSGISSLRLRQGNLSKGDMHNLLVSYNDFTASEIYIDDSTKGTPLDIKAKSRRMKMDKSIDFLIIDYLQMMHLDKRVENKQVEISEISRSLKLLAKELNIPVIALAQLSRNPEKRENKEPILSDIRDSGSIEQDADVVIFIHRKFKEGVELDDAKLIISKQRNGPTGDIEIHFDPAHTLFKPKARQQ
ncbi:MAG: replicative DNA helicase [bacterium]|nr:replicative DNA helicase [bacterium]